MLNFIQFDFNQLNIQYKDTNCRNNFPNIHFNDIIKHCSGLNY